MHAGRGPVRQLSCITALDDDQQSGAVFRWLSLRRQCDHARRSDLALALGATRPRHRRDRLSRGGVAPGPGHGLGRDLHLLPHGHLRASADSLASRGNRASRAASAIWTAADRTIPLATFRILATRLSTAVGRGQQPRGRRSTARLEIVRERSR